MLNFAKRIIFLLVLSQASDVWACAFCSEIIDTLTNELKNAKVVVKAVSTGPTPQLDGQEASNQEFQVTESIKGDCPPGFRLRTLCWSEVQQGETYLIKSFGGDPYHWEPPTLLTTEAVAFLEGLKTVPAMGRERLLFFLPYLESDDSLVANDAYNEFARASFTETAELRNDLSPDWVVQQIRDGNVSVRRRRLYWTLLSICGTQNDIGLFDELLERHRVDDTFRIGLDAAIACVVSLGEEAALQRIERQYLGNPDAEYGERYAAIMAVRAHDAQWEQFSRLRLAQALRHVLVTPELADLVIPDLVKWQDWSVIPRLVELFENANEETQFVRVPVLKYLIKCPEPHAADALAQLSVQDPEAVRLAREQIALAETAEQGPIAAAPLPPTAPEFPESPEPPESPEEDEQVVSDEYSTVSLEVSATTGPADSSWIWIGVLVAVGCVTAGYFVRTRVCRLCK
ncbi:MAG: hypothetical protein GY768_26675 [Planctomycetaceae bacterium]|nr:hypothetical protein [Planctomycetaceae bacterium]